MFIASGKYSAECPAGLRNEEKELYRTGACNRGCEGDGYRYCWRLGVLSGAAKEIYLMVFNEEARTAISGDLVFSGSGMAAGEGILRVAADPNSPKTAVTALFDLLRAQGKSRTRSGSLKYCLRDVAKQSSEGPADLSELVDALEEEGQEISRNG